MKKNLKQQIDAIFSIARYEILKKFDDSGYSPLSYASWEIQMRNYQEMTGDFIAIKNQIVDCIQKNDMEHR